MIFFYINELIDELIFAHTKDPGTSFQVTVFVEFFDNFIILEYDINWPTFINRLCLLAKIFSKMYFFFNP